MWEVRPGLDVVAAREGLRFQAGVFQFGVSGLELRVSGSGFRVSVLGFRVSGFGFQGSNARFRVSGFEHIGLRCWPGCGRSTPGRAVVFEFRVQGFRAQCTGYRC